MIPNQIKKEIMIVANVPLNWAVSAMFGFIMPMIILQSILNFFMLILLIINIECFILYLFLPYANKLRNYHLLIDTLHFATLKGAYVW